MTDFKYDPWVLQRGVPPEQRNGLYGQEATLIDLGIGGRMTVAVTVEVADIRTSEKEGTQWPVVQLVHMEPITTAEGIEAVRGAQEAAYKDRTGANQLNFEGLATDAPTGADDDQVARDAAFEAAAPVVKVEKK